MFRGAARQLYLVVVSAAIGALTLSVKSQESSGGETSASDNPKLIRIRATPGSKPKSAASKHTPLLKVERTPAPNGGLSEPDDFMLKFNYLFGDRGKLRPTPTPEVVAEDKKTTAERVAEMARQLRANMTPRPESAKSDWIQNATPAPAAYVAPTPKPVVRIVTPPPKSSLPAINLGGDSTSSYP